MPSTRMSVPTVGLSLAVRRVRTGANGVGNPTEEKLSWQYDTLKHSTFYADPAAMKMAADFLDSYATAARARAEAKGRLPQYLAKLARIEKLRAAEEAERVERAEAEHIGASIIRSHEKRTNDVLDFQIARVGKPLTAEQEQCAKLMRQQRVQYARPMLVEVESR